MPRGILECDLGNTRYKWRLVENGCVTQQGSAAHKDGYDRLAGIDVPSRIRVASVVAEEILDDFRLALAPLGVEPEIAGSQRWTAGVSNAYGDDYQKLGVDRWLAVVAGHKRVGAAVLVLDAGSALTADLVDDRGSHLGGYIMPGGRLMKAALIEDTGRVRFENTESIPVLDFGRSTRASVDAGVLAAQVGAAKVAIEQAYRRIPTGFAILVTGGAGAGMMDYLPDTAIWMPDLVLDGLTWVLP